MQGAQLGEEKIYLKKLINALICLISPIHAHKENIYNE